MQANTPNTIYTAWVRTDDGLVNVSDDKTSFDDVLDMVVSTPWGDVPFRMIRLDFDVETGVLETSSDVTEDAQEIIDRRLTERGLAAE